MRKFSIKAKLDWSITLLKSWFPDLISPSHISPKHSDQLGALIFESSGLILVEDLLYFDGKISAGDSRDSARPDEISDIATDLFNHAKDLNQYFTVRFMNRASNVLTNLLKWHHACQKLLNLTSNQREVQLKQYQLLELEEQKKLATSVTI